MSAVSPGGPSRAGAADTMRAAATGPASSPGGAAGRPWRRATLVLPAIGAALVLATWWAVATWLAPAPGFLSRFAPAHALAALGRLAASGELWPHLVTSLRRVLVGLTLSATVGLPLGLTLARVRAFAGLFGPVFQFIRMVSPLSWTPLAIIVLGVGDAPVYFLIAVGGVWPIALNASAGLVALDRRWTMVARSLGANRREVLRTVVWPGIRPHVLTGLRLAVGLAWLILVPAEMLGVDSGLGYFVLNTRDRLAYDELVAAILVIGACGFAIDSLARWAFRERHRGPPRPGRLAGAASLHPPATAVATTGSPARPTPG